MKKFKKIYIEITNYCNLHCFFCPNQNRDNLEMEVTSFEEILKKIDSFTDYLYLHVKGEPLLHSKLDEILDLTESYHKKVNITTNGTLLRKQLEILCRHDNIRQINISLHNMRNNLADLFEVIDLLLQQTKIIICLRLWNGDTKENEDIWKFLKERYGYERQNNKIDENLFIDCEEYFEWPSLTNDYLSDQGTCLALRMHLAILVDGTVVPCCLDEAGIINLGNIFEQDLSDILASERSKKILDNFLKNKKCEALCQRCNFYK